MEGKGLIKICDVLHRKYMQHQCTKGEHIFQQYTIIHVASEVRYQVGVFSSVLLHQRLPGEGVFAT